MLYYSKISVLNRNYEEILIDLFEIGTWKHKQKVPPVLGRHLNDQYSGSFT